MPHSSLYPTIDIPDVHVYDFLFERKDRPYPDNHPAFTCANSGRIITFADARDQSKRFGIGLKCHWQWKKGDVMAMCSTNHIEYPLILWGTLWCGGVVTPANPAYTVDELTYQLKDSKAKAICTIPAFYQIVLQAASNAGIPKDRIIFLGDKPTEGWPDQLHSWKDIYDPSATSYWRKPSINPGKDMGLLVYSSGTTGRPKGVMISHRNLVANILQIYYSDSRDNLTWQKDKMLAFLPFFHIYALTSILHQSLFAGITAVVMERFDLEKYCQVVQEEKITYSYVVPPIILLLAKHPCVSKYDLSSLRMLNSGAAPLTKDLVEALYKRAQIPVKQAYGMTELSPTTHMQGWTDWKVYIGSVGILLPNITAKYVSEDGTELEPGQTGELWLKGPNVMLGYYNNPEATKDAITEDGYYKTGDVGYVDEKGNFYITDRVKELIKYKGFPVAPAELEGVLAVHPKVEDCAVLGLFAPDLETEVPTAFVVLKKGIEADRATEKELVDFVAGKVAPHKKIRGGVRFVKIIPKTASGKILRRVLKNQALEEGKSMNTNQSVKAKL